MIIPTFSAVSKGNFVFKPKVNSPITNNFSTKIAAQKKIATANVALQWRNQSKAGIPMTKLSKQEILGAMKGAATGYKEGILTKNQAVEQAGYTMAATAGFVREQAFTTGYPAAREQLQFVNEAEKTNTALINTQEAYGELKTKYDALLNAPPSAGFDIGSIFGDIGKYIPYVLLGIGAIIFLPMILSKRK